MFHLIPLIILLPLLGLLVNLVNGRRHHEPTAGIIASSAAGLAFVVAISQFIALLRQPEGTVITLATWLRVHEFSARRQGYHRDLQARDPARQGRPAI
jgi:NADH:ubiquinone oxidoreductase subunit 5 (subunit L)/multisubunit Na+/H+ antiporter MnhA subunit